LFFSSWPDTSFTARPRTRG